MTNYPKLVVVVVVVVLVVVVIVIMEKVTRSEIIYKTMITDLLHTTVAVRVSMVLQQYGAVILFTLLSTYLLLLE
jgi:hypothetical protein